MKVFAVVLLALGSVSASGSGPYLPSGWRPQGPAFYLPSEVQIQPEPIKETIVVEAEASGSDSFQEYGPPKVEESQNLISQGLPDAVTEQLFFVAEEKAVADVQSAQVIPEITSEVQEVVTTAQIAEEATTEATTEAVQLTEAPEATTPDIAEVFGDVTAAVEENLEQVVVEKEKVVEEVKAIAETLVNLENVVVSEQVQTIQAAAEVTQEGSGSVSAPEGFLEYGPPGFKEYGPPKSDDLLSAVETPSLAYETNEARRRRFSPKFRATKPKRSH